MRQKRPTWLNFCQNTGSKIRKIQKNEDYETAIQNTQENSNQRNVRRSDCDVMYIMCNRPSVWRMLCASPKGLSASLPSSPRWSLPSPRWPLPSSPSLIPSHNSFRLHPMGAIWCIAKDCLTLREKHSGGCVLQRTRLSSALLGEGDGVWDKTVGCEWLTKDGIPHFLLT